MTNASPLVGPKSSRLRRNPPRVRPHSRGVWTVCIGKAVSRDKSKLRPRDHYFTSTEADANATAEKIAREWAFLVKGWAKLYQPTLTLIGSPFADTPHWQPALAQRQPSAAAADAFANATPTPDEVGEAYADITLNGAFALYKVKLQTDVANGDKGKTTTWTDEKNVRNALQFVDGKQPLANLTPTAIAQAKGVMLAKLSRRTASNYLEALKRLIVWVYESDYGRDLDKPSKRPFDEAFIVKKATTTAVNIPTTTDLARIVGNADDRQRLAVLLALNCGMYQADIGRLTLDEIDLANGYVYWDREKQPRNAFKVRHDLWPETLAVVKRCLQPSGKPTRLFTDYRGHTPTDVDCSRLAFVDGSGNPLYRVRKSGKAYDKIGTAWQRLNKRLGNSGGATYQFHNLRKATNQILTDLLNNKIDGDDRGQLIAVQEISDMFLGHKTTELERVYRTRGANGFGRLNKYLAEVGDVLRKADVLAAAVAAESA